jgi:hypothetical protein
VNINFVENDTAEKPANLQWDPDDTVVGGREYLFIMKSDYDGGVGYGDGNELPDGLTSDVMFGGWPRVRSGHVFLETVPSYLRFFLGTPEDPYGACCTYDLACSIIKRSECMGPFKGDGSSCDPNPCEAADAPDDAPPSSLGIFLRSPVPNPAETGVALTFRLPKTAHVEIRVYNAQGALIRSLLDGRREAGIHQVHWDSRDERGREVAQGIYYAQLLTDGFKVSRKIVLLR